MAVRRTHAACACAAIVAGLSIVLLDGCATSRSDIFLQPVSSWSSRDCLTVIASSMSHNLGATEDEIQIIATPYYPHVVAAINRLQEVQYRWDTTEARNHLDVLLQSSAGLYVDWAEKNELVTSGGRYVRKPSDIDSLLVLLDVTNKGYPVNLPLISHLEDGIYLTNGKGETLKPRFVWGKARNTLLKEEKYFVRFVFAQKDKRDFLRDPSQIFLVVSSFGRPITLRLSFELPRLTL